MLVIYTVIALIRTAEGETFFFFNNSTIFYFLGNLFATLSTEKKDNSG